MAGKKLSIVVVATAKVRIFKQITTGFNPLKLFKCCCCYRKGTNFQANHNGEGAALSDTRLLLLPQRYEFSSKSQPNLMDRFYNSSCCCYRKGTNFQANHNVFVFSSSLDSLLLLPQRYEFSSKSQQDYDSPASLSVVVAIAKVRIFKQITTQYRL